MTKTAEFAVVSAGAFGGCKTQMRECGRRYQQSATWKTMHDHLRMFDWERDLEDEPRT